MISIVQNSKQQITNVLHCSHAWGLYLYIKEHANEFNKHTEELLYYSTSYNLRYVAHNRQILHSSWAPTIESITDLKFSI